MVLGLKHGSLGRAPAFPSAAMQVRRPCRRHSDLPTAASQTSLSWALRPATVLATLAENRYRLSQFTFLQRFLPSPLPTPSVRLTHSTWSFSPPPTSPFQGPHSHRSNSTQLSSHEPQVCPQPRPLFRVLNHRTSSSPRGLK